MDNQNRLQFHARSTGYPKLASSRYKSPAPERRARPLIKHSLSMVDSESRSIERVRVAVRVRPRNHREETIDASSKALHTIDVDDANGKIYVSKRKPDRNNTITNATTALVTDPAIDRELRCTYDRVFAPSATQNDVFDYVRDAVQQVAQGFNCTIFAYGQTGTGKTHTMLGRDLEKNIEAMAVSGSVTRDDQWGVIPRAIESLFEELESIARNNAAAAIVHCSYMQIYNNEVYDLLQENKSRMKEPLAVREMIKGNDKQIYVSGLSEFRVGGLDETLRLLRQGNKNRTIRATEYNEKSSRSHALLQLSAEVESRGVEGPTTIIRRAKLNLVDLAGSEKWDTDVSMGSDRCKELTSINQSLSALGNVISALANPRRTHVPYRDAKLTRLLQDSLGGNTRTTVIATISQDESAIDETISTLLFADRAKCVTLRVKANEVVDDAVLLAQARREIARLKLVIKKNASQEQMNELEQKVAKLTQENALLASENKRLKQAMAAMKKDKDKLVVVSRTASSLGSVEPEVGDPVPLTMMQSPPHAPTSTHSTHKLRLEIEPPHHGPPTPRSRSISSSKSNQTHAAVHDDGDEGVVAVAAAVIKAEQDQSRLLEQIQSERRALERELERIEIQQTPRKHVDDNTGNNGEPQSCDDDACPICGRLIDDHSDEELDSCIEQETAAMKQSRMASGAMMRSVTPQGSRPPTQSTIAHPRTPPPVRKLSTPRGHDANNSKKPASPYSQELFLTPQSPASLLLSPSQPQPPQVSQQAASRLGGSNITQRRSVRDLAKARSSPRDDQETEARPLTADSHPHSSNNSDQGQEIRHLNVPIVRQGSKSVKALKKFQASSPYNNATKTTKRFNGSAGSPPRKSPVSKGNQSISSTSTAPGTEARVLTGSMRDVGLSLLIYKFRYDCWYPCTVVGYDAKRRLHCCQYEYGDKQWQELSQHKIKLVEPATTSSE